MKKLSHSEDPLLHDILKKIEFRLLREDTPGSLYDPNDFFKAEGFSALDVANTHIHDEETKLFDVDFLKTPRLSTVAMGYIINQLVRYMPKNTVYLNIGTWCGFSFLSGLLGNEGNVCIGVDNFTTPAEVPNIFKFQHELFKTKNSHFFEMDYLDYFRTIHTQSIGVYFYDGDHSYENQYKGLEIAEPFLAHGSYIIVDDTNWPEPYNATIDYVQKMKGTYEVVLDTKTANNNHPTFWNGILILRKN